MGWRSRGEIYSGWECGSERLNWRDKKGPSYKGFINQVKEFAYSKCAGNSLKDFMQ